MTRGVSWLAVVLLAVAALRFGAVSRPGAMVWASPALQSDLSALAVLTPDNNGALAEAMRIDAKGVTEALFFPDGEQMALAIPEGVVLYDVATWTA